MNNKTICKTILHRCCRQPPSFRRLVALQTITLQRTLSFLDNWSNGRPVNDMMLSQAVFGLPRVREPETMSWITSKLFQNVAKVWQFFTFNIAKTTSIQGRCSCKKVYRKRAVVAEVNTSKSYLTTITQKFSQSDTNPRLTSWNPGSFSSIETCSQLASISNHLSPTPHATSCHLEFYHYYLLVSASSTSNQSTNRHKYDTGLLTELCDCRTVPLDSHTYEPKSRCRTIWLGSALHGAINSAMTSCSANGTMVKQTKGQD